MTVKKFCRMCEEFAREFGEEKGLFMHYAKEDDSIVIFASTDCKLLTVSALDMPIVVRKSDGDIYYTHDALIEEYHEYVLTEYLLKKLR